MLRSLWIMDEASFLVTVTSTVQEHVLISIQMLAFGNFKLYVINTVE